MNKQFLNWIADRIVHVYGESPHVDFVSKLRYIANEPVADSKAITALTGMVKAFGSGVLATDTVQAAALAKAYACIEGDLMGKAEQSHGTKAAVEPVPAVQIFGWPEAGGTIAEYVKKNEGKRVRVVFTDTEMDAEIGTIDSDGIGGNYFWLLEDQKSDFTRYRNSITFADVESITREKKPLMQDMEPVEADRSVGDVAKDWPGGGSTLADYVERNKGNRVRIEFTGNGVPDSVGTIERIGSIMYFWLRDDSSAHGGRFSVSFCDVHTITWIPTRAVEPALPDFMADKLGAVVRITLKNNNVHAGTAVRSIHRRAENGGAIDYFWVSNKDGMQNIYFADIKHVDVLTEHSGTFPATFWPYSSEEPAVLPESWEQDDAARKAAPDNWPGGGVSLNSFLNARIGQLVSVNYGAGSNVEGELFRDPVRQGQYRLLLRTGTVKVFLADVVRVSCDK